jgi:hypothetical protein
MRLVLLLIVALAMPAVQAGRACAKDALRPDAVQAASIAAQRTFAALEAGPGEVALVARVGQDLSAHGLRYSHVGLVMRDHPAGRWTVIHLLNTCGTNRSGVYAEGLLNFFLDGMVSYDSRIIWLQPTMEASVLAHLREGQALAIHHPNYNLIARPDSRANQNSTGWTLSLLGLALDDTHVDAVAGIKVATQYGFRPSVLRLSYTKRLLGGLFSANADFTDHPLKSRLRGRYPVVTVRSIFEWLRRADLVRAEWSTPGALQLD